MIPKPKSELTAIFISLTIMIGAITGIGFFYLTSSISTILNTISQTESDVLGNLTVHRIVANITQDEQIDNQKIIIELLKNLTR